MEIRLLTDTDYSEELNIVADELIDQYANEQVSADERLLLERFIFESAERRNKFKFALALKKRASESKRRKRRLGRMLRFYLPIAASILLIVGLGVWWFAFYPSEIDKGLSALRMAYREQRPVEARMTDFDYAPTLRGQEKVDSTRRDLAAALLMSAVGEHPDAYSHRALGQYYIAAHRFENAVQQLTASLALDPQNAKAHSDLGVALLELGKEAAANSDPGLGFKHYAESLDHIKKALEFDESLLEARFNLALVLQKMALQQPAAEAWRKYLEKDSQSAWADEARANLSALEERRQKTPARSGTQALEDFLAAYKNGDDDGAWRIFSQNREVVAGRFLPERLVNAYLDSATGGRTENAASMLAALEYAGELEARKAGDYYTAGLARFYRSFSPARLGTLAKAYRLAGRGYELCQRSAFVEASLAFNEARRTFASAGDEIESAFADYWLAFSYYHSNQTEKSLSTSQTLIRYCKEKGYKWLLAQALNLLSNIQTGFHEPSAVLNLTREALSLSQQVSDAYGTQKHLASLAGKLGHLYNFPESLNHLARCLLLADDFWPGSRQAWRNYDTAAQVFGLMGLNWASAIYAEAALRLALESKDPSFIYLSHVHLGMAYGHLQNYSEGVKHAQTGFAIGSSLADEVAGRKIMAYSALQLGELDRQRANFKEAARSYDQSIELYDQLSFQTFSVVAHRGRLLTYLALGDDTSAERELHVVLGLFEKYREKVKEEDNRVYFFDVAQDIYDAATDFTYSRLGDAEAAFGHNENSRARSLLVTMNSDATRTDIENSAARPLSVREIRERMPEQVQILQYAVLGDKLLIWVISRAGSWSTTKDISNTALSAQAHNYLRLVTRPTSNAEDVRRAGYTLYESLIRPVEEHLDTNKTLCIVPDKILNYLPFAALASPTSGRYLIQDHPLFFSPSSTVFVVNSDVAREKKQALSGEKLLSVGNPTFDRRAFPSLPDLPSAATEAEAVARYYVSVSPVVLTGGEATKESVTKAIGDSDVIHLASHYVVDERSPMSSQLLLAKPDGQEDSYSSARGSLLAGDIYNMKLGRPRLAVLSACRTGVEHYYNGEGMIGMARTFLGAGVPVVVASQWPVDTLSTSGLMVRFHSHRRTGLPTVEALRAAQREIIDDPSTRYRHPYYWAPFVTIGGYAPF